jgi:NAD(P)-dependent dehydrogenase (short-subunit alcohol dehydrogenase family)
MMTGWKADDAMKDRVVLITGAGSGIGRALALLCAEKGCKIAIVDKNNEAGEIVARETIEVGAPASISIAADVSLEEDVEHAFSEADKYLGLPTAICASAGVDKGGPFHDISSDLWRHVMAVNLDGVFFTVKRAIKRLLEAKSKGSIVLVSSPAASVGFAAGGAGAYSASKGAISALVRSLAVEYAHVGIRVNALVPGATETPLAWSNVDAARIPEYRRQLSNEIPLGRLATPREPASAAFWLLSDDSAYVTGSNLVCDGGILAKGSISF